MDAPLAAWARELVAETFIYARYHALDRAVSHARLLETVETLLAELLRHRPTDVEGFLVRLLDEMIAGNYRKEETQPDSQSPFFLVSSNALFCHLDEGKRRLLAAACIRRTVPAGSLLNPTSGYAVLSGEVSSALRGSEERATSGFINLEGLMNLNDEALLELHSVPDQATRDGLVEQPVLRAVSDSVVLEVPREAYQHLCINAARVEGSDPLSLVRRQPLFECLEAPEQETLVRCLRLRTFACGERMDEAVGADGLLLVSEGLATENEGGMHVLLCPASVVQPRPGVTVTAGSPMRLTSVTSTPEDIQQGSFCLAYTLDLSELARHLGRARMRLLRERVKMYGV